MSAMSMEIECSGTAVSRLYRTTGIPLTDFSYVDAMMETVVVDGCCSGWVYLGICREERCQKKKRTSLTEMVVGPPQVYDEVNCLVVQVGQSGRSFSRGHQQGLVRQ
jgi:hypothetical protein